MAHHGAIVPSISLMCSHSCDAMSPLRVRIQGPRTAPAAVSVTRLAIDATLGVHNEIGAEVGATMDSVEVGQLAAERH